MRRFRFHVGTLVILVLLLGVGFAALRESDATWDTSIFSITLGMLSVSILLTVHRIGKRRAFWLGFALFGWIYLGLSVVPSIESRLITTKALAYLDSQVPDRAIVIGGRVWDSWSSQLAQNENFVRIGHSLLSLIAGILGGLLSRHLYARKWQSARSRPIR
jgi:hypothetical protein